MDYTVEKAKDRQTTVTFSPYGTSGIRMVINKKKRTLDIYGWYDSMVGISGGEISLDTLTELFK